MDVRVKSGRRRLEQRRHHAVFAEQRLRREAAALTAWSPAQPSSNADGDGPQENAQQDWVPQVALPTKIQLVREERDEGDGAADIHQEAIFLANRQTKTDDGQHPSYNVGQPVERSGVRPARTIEHVERSTS